MDGALAGYVRALRAAGAETSIAEAIDAARAVALLGYADRGDLKAALGLALAKSAEDKKIHERVFDLYFSAPAETAVHAAGGAGNAGASPGAPQPPSSGGDAGLEHLLALAEGARPGSTREAGDELQLALRRAAAAAGVDEIRFATQTANLTERMLQHLGIDALEARLSGLAEEDSPAARAEARALRAARIDLSRAARAVVGRRFEIFGRPATEAFMTEVAVQRPLGRMAPAEMETMKAAVARMARKLAARHSRQQRVKLPSQLDMRRTLRANAGHGGVPFTLVYRQRRRDRPRIVAVCDVSGSVAAHVRFLLLFLYALHDAVGDLKSFAFAHRLRDVGAAMESLPFDDAMALILNEVDRGATDYGQAWADLAGQHADCIDRRTTLLVLGDGRSNGTNPRLDLFADLAGRAKRVLWLCPEPPGRWGSGDSEILRYRPFCSALTYCATAADLERALDEVLAAYH